MPLYGGEPYYSPDDVTVELEKVEDTVEITARRSLFSRLWNKWELWLVGLAIVACATASTVAMVAAGHQCCAAPPPVPTPTVTVTKTQKPAVKTTPTPSARRS